MSVLVTFFSEGSLFLITGKLAIRHPDRGCPLFEEMHNVFRKDSVASRDVCELFTEVSMVGGETCSSCHMMDIGQNVFKLGSVFYSFSP